jgi:uncharacterized membrane protein
MKHVTITDSAFVADAASEPARRPRGRPIHSMPASFSIAYFTGALVTDLVYWQTPDVLWERFSIWLIAAGLVMAGLAAVAYVFDLASGRQIDRPALPGVVGYGLAVVLSLINAFVHSRDGYTAVVPSGLALSGLVVAVLVLTALARIALRNRHRVGG